MPEGEYETLAGFVLDQLGRIPGPERDSTMTAGGSKWSPWTDGESPRCASWRRGRQSCPTDRQRVMSTTVALLLSSS